MKLKWILRMILLMPLLPGCGHDDPAVVPEGLYINEIYAASGEDWIELYNDTDESKNLGGYKIYDDADNKYVLPNSTSISAKGFLVIVCDDSGIGLNASFKLSASGETVTLENASGVVVDEVIFPAMNAGESYGRYPDGSTTIKISGNTTRGASNGSEIAPIISNVTRTPLVVLSNTQPVISANVMVGTGSTLKTATLYVSVDGGLFNPVPMTLAGGTTFYATMSAYENATVEYYIEASTTSNVESLSPFDAPDNVYQYTVSNAALPELFVNEIMAANTSCCPDIEGGVQEFDDWIEIYNGGSQAVDIGGMFLSDDPSNPFKNKIPDANPVLTTIQPGGYLVLWADENGSQGDLHLNFQLGSTGETVGIYYYDGRTIDERTFGTQTENKSSGLSPDGSNNWVLLANPSQGSSNN